MFRALILGGTGIISRAVTKQLQARGGEVTIYNRGRTAPVALAGVRQLVGDRDDRDAFVAAFANERFDVVIDMICFTPEHAEDSVRAFSGRCEHFLFCSSAVVYGPTLPAHVLVDETSPLQPVSGYGHAKVACERLFTGAAERGAFALTIVRAGHTYGPGGPMDDQLGVEGTWDRVVRGLPVLLAGDGLGLWQATHRDDCARFFAHAALLPQTYNETYNAVRDEVFTWRDYYREVARALDTTAKIVCVPTRWLLTQGALEAGPGHFGFLEEISRFHCAVSSAKARAHVAEFRPQTLLEAGARETFADVRARGAWTDGTDPTYQALIDRALSLGFEVEDA